MKLAVLALVTPLIALGGCVSTPGGAHAGHHMDGAAAQHAPGDAQAMQNCPMMGQQPGQGSMMQGMMSGGQGQMMQPGAGTMNCRLAQPQTAPTAPAEADPHGH